MNKVHNLKNKEQKISFISIIFIVSFTFPLIIFGIKDLEEYQLGYFTLKTYVEYPESFWHGYLDLYGPGIKLPIGHFPFLHPANFFLFDTQFHYFFYIFINLTIQVFFLDKIFKFLFKNSHFIILIVIFSISNFNYLYSDDFPHASFTFTIFFPTFFYLIKFLDTKKWISYFKFIFWISYGLLNGHFGTLATQYILFIFFILLNRNFFFLKNIKFYLGLIIGLLITSSTLFHLFNEFLQFDKNASATTTINYNIKDFIYSIFNPFFDFETVFPQNRSSYYGILVPTALIISIKKFFDFEKSRKIFFIDKIFLISIILSLSSYSKNFYVISAIWQFRDFYNIIAIILVFYYFKDKKFTFQILIGIQIFITLFFYLNNFKYLDFSRSNFISKNNTYHDKLFYDDENVNNKFEKTYLSPKVYAYVRNGFKDYGTYSITDLQLENIYTLNGWFKNYSVDDFQKPETKMHGKIESSYEDLNNTVFLKSFLVMKIIFFESERQHFNIKNYKISKIVRFKNDNLIYAEIINKKFPIIKKPEDLTLDCNQKKIFIKCLLKNNSELGSIKIKRLKLNQYEITNKNNYNVSIIFPFTEYKNWLSNKKKLQSYNGLKKIGILKLDAKEKIIFTYRDNLRFMLNILSLISLVALILIINLKLK